ncbi:unnamed protein product [Prunus brigantina]
MLPCEPFLVCNSNHRPMSLTFPLRYKISGAGGGTSCLMHELIFFLHDTCASHVGSDMVFCSTWDVFGGGVWCEESVKWWKVAAALDCVNAVDHRVCGGYCDLAVLSAVSEERRGRKSY